jgi:hypothetical protein
VVARTGQMWPGITMNVYGKTTSGKAAVDAIRKRWQSPWVQVDMAGGAFVMMSREAAQKMAEAFKSLAVVVGANRIPSVAVFQPFVEQRAHAGEDISFFRRWLSLEGSEIWAYVGAGARLSHTGPATVRANFENVLQGVDDGIKYVGETPDGEAR